MPAETIIVDSYFDGERHHQHGPYGFLIADGRIAAILPAAQLALVAPPAAAPQRAAFLMPGLVDAHVHLFLDGTQLDATRRADYLKAPLDEMLAVAAHNAAATLACGITTVRDAGDRFGINHRLRAAAAERDAGLPAVRSAGLGLKRPKRYGAFMGRDVADSGEIVAAVHELAADCDDIKLILTGIIDFDAGRVAGEPQFDLESAALVVRTAHALGKRVFAHCSGTAGLDVAIAAKVDSIEHGFFMSCDRVRAMADRGIAWTPTFAPVHFQWARPEVAGWSPQTVDNIARILGEHAENLVRADAAGVTLLCGSDAGSHGVGHGTGLLDELQWLHEAGLSVTAVLRAATGAARRHWGEPALLAAGTAFDAVLLEASPFERFTVLREPLAVFRNGSRQVSRPGTLRPAATGSAGRDRVPPASTATA